MEFNGQYLTYEEYKSLGGALNLMPFNLLEYEVRKKIDLRTHNRLINNDIPNEVKMCEFNMINRVENYAKTLNDTSNVASENTDGYSVSYITPNQISDIVKSKDKELDDIMLEYLYSVIVNNEHILDASVQ